MKLVRCANGRFYDKDSIDECPYCQLKQTDDTKTMEKKTNELKPGSIIANKYIIVNIIGRGGTSIVYKGKTYEGEMVVIKEFFPYSTAIRNTENSSLSLENEEQFTNQKKLFIDGMSKLNELRDLDGVVKIYDLLEDNNTVYVIMELLDGITLRRFQYIHKKEEIPENIIKEIMYCILFNLYQIHQRKLLVLDIASSNIMLTNDGKIKFIDMGSVQYESDKKYSVTVNQLYAPPEVYCQGDIGYHTDIFEVAMVFYMLLFRKKPRKSIDRLKDDLDTFAILDENIDSKIKNALEHGLTLDIKKRTKNVSEFIYELFGYNEYQFKTPDYKMLQHFIFQKSDIYESEINFPAINTDDMSKTVTLCNLGIDINDIEKVDVNEVAKEKQAYIMLLNEFKTLDVNYKNSLDKIKNLERETEDRKNSTIMMTIGEIVLAFGIAFITDFKITSIITVIAGLIITVYALYLSFKK